MNLKVLLYLLPLLVLLTRPAMILSETHYKQQVIAILEQDPTVEAAARFLYNKHDTISHVVMWDSQSGTFERVEWDDEIKGYEPTGDQSPLPIGDGNTFKWDETRVQVLGHGEYIENNVKFGSENPSEIIGRIVDKISKGKNIKQISVVGCLPESIPNGRAYELVRELTIDFVEALGSKELFQTEVSVRSALVSVDNNGRKLTGKLRYNGNKKTGIEWKHKDSLVKLIGAFDNDRNPIIKDGIPGDTEESHYFGILPSGTDIWITPEDKYPKISYRVTSGVTLPDSNALAVSDAFKWVNKVAEEIYGDIDEASRAEAKKYKVQFLDGVRGVAENQPVREIRSIDDFLIELKYYGELGQGIPKAKNNAVCYRFGDWVVTMNLDNFYVSVEGVIISDTDSDAKREEVNNIKEHWQKLDEKYRDMQPNTGDNFFDNVNSWINGQHEKIGLTVEDAYNAQCGMAMFLSESIRCFHNHITNMMALSLVRAGYLTKEFFFNSNPMARGGSWQLRYENGKLKTGLDLMTDPILDSNEQRTIVEEMRKVRDLISRFGQTWLSHVDVDGVMGSRQPAPGAETAEYNFHSNMIDNLKDVAQRIGTYLRDYELKYATTYLLSSLVSEAENEAVDTQINDFKTSEDRSLSVRTSIALTNDHEYVSDVINKEITEKSQQTGKKYQIVPNSVEIEEDSEKVRFEIEADWNPDLKKVRTAIDRSRLFSREMIEQMQRESKEFARSTDTEGGKLAKFNRGFAIFNTVIGLFQSIGSLENGDMTQGVTGLAHTIYGIGELTEYNQKISKAAGKFLSRALRQSVKDLAESASVTGEEAGAFVEQAGGEIMSTAGKIENFLEKGLSPIIGTAFGIYNIIQDFKQHSILGYIDGVLDIAITGVSLLGPEAEPLKIALTILRMVIGIFYNDISDELDKLPPHASVVDKIDAVLAGIAKSFLDILKEFTPWGAIDNSNKLNQEYNKEQNFLAKLSDYHNYFNIKNEKGSSTKNINFAGGSDSWDGGNITFHLGENSQSTLKLEVTNKQGQIVQETHQIDTHGVEDITMGIGEAHTISFKKVTVKLFWFIPVNSKTVINKVTGDKNTLHGTYYGNSKNNRFMAVQNISSKTADDLGYQLSDYYYRLFGREGNDSFFLGPQHTYVEGNEGSDTYFINSESVHTEINNYATDGVTDYIIVDLFYGQLTPCKMDEHLYLILWRMFPIEPLNGVNSDKCQLLRTENDHIYNMYVSMYFKHLMILRNWFVSETYQHIIFQTSDGVLFKVSATSIGGVEFIPFAINGAQAKTGQTIDARILDFSQVTALVGSDHDDVIHGNDIANRISGGLGSNLLSGGNGKDTYIITTPKPGADTINNYATDGRVDTLVIANVTLEMLTATTSTSSHDLFLSQLAQDGHEKLIVTIKNWFVSDEYRHMILMTEDGAANMATKQLFTGSEHASSIPVHLQPLFINMSSIELNITSSAGDKFVYDRKLNLSADPQLYQVTSIFGTSQNDLMIGNRNDNYMTGGRGSDKMIGMEGADVYVSKRGDGELQIDNYAIDASMDTLLFEANFSDIKLNRTDDDLVLSGGGQEVTLERWFSGPQYQHLLVRSLDVVFQLPTRKITKTPKILDNSKKNRGVDVCLTGEWETVERVIGSQGHDLIIGNSQNNYIDPNTGGFHLQGANGSDTYVIKSTYGKGIIENFAEDQTADMLQFSVPYSSISTTVKNGDVTLTSNTGQGLVDITLSGYVNRSNEKYQQHLSTISSDGILFLIQPVNKSNLITVETIPIIINKAHSDVGQRINLSANANHTHVRTVLGASARQNYIVGNDVNNTLIGGSQSDHLEGSGGDNILKGGGGNDTIIGGPGRDTIVGGSGNDTLWGGEGDDVIAPGLGTNQVDGGPGSDTVIYSGDVLGSKGIILDLTTGKCVHEGSEDNLTSIESAYGTEFNDILMGDGGDNVLVGLGGDDYLVSVAGYDILNGGNGSDTYNLSSVTNGTITILNYAADQVQDMVLMNYCNKSELSYERSRGDLVVRVINAKYPVFTDINRPTVIFRDFYSHPKNSRHISMSLSDGVINLNEFGNERKTAVSVPLFLPIVVVCVLVLISIALVFIVLYMILRLRARKKAPYDPALTVKLLGNNKFNSYT